MTLNRIGKFEKVSLDVISTENQNHGCAVGKHSGKEGLLREKDLDPVVVTGAGGIV